MRLMSRIRDGRNEPDGRARNRFRRPNRRALPDRSEGRGNREPGSRRDDRRCLRRRGGIARCARDARAEIWANAKPVAGQHPNFKADLHLGPMPKIFNKILYPIGFDRNSAAALKFAHELADPNKSTLFLLHVVSAPSIEPIMLEPNPIRFSTGPTWRPWSSESPQSSCPAVLSHSAA